SYFQPVNRADGYQSRKEAMIFGVGTSSAISVPLRVENLTDLISLNSPDSERSQILPKEKSLTAAAWKTAPILPADADFSFSAKSAVVLNCSTCWARRSPQ